MHACMHAGKEECRHGGKAAEGNAFMQADQQGDGKGGHMQIGIYADRQMGIYTQIGRQVSRCACR